MFSTLDRDPGMGDRSNTTPVPTKDRTTEKNADIRPCLERGFKQTSQMFDNTKSEGSLGTADF
jgi:hypothetical protein